MIKLYNGDCLDVMATLPDKSIDFICCDLPYGITDFDWDVAIPMDKLWEQYERTITDTGSIALFASGKFLPVVLSCNPTLYRYLWVWEKNTSTMFVHARNRPMTKCEFICMFSKGTPNHEGLAKQRMLYNPQGVTLAKTPKVHKSRMCEIGRFLHGHHMDAEFTQEYEGYPSDVLHFKNCTKTLHPTEKPVPLLEYLIKTYTNEGMTVLDNCMGSGSCGEACIRTNRQFIGIELDKKCYDIAENRLKNLKWQGGLLE
jgi:site-specific DNA-methyltransferase (adenine-specific)